ncbi:hypothetical protein P691DRAFT_757473 [Macrolepiota fuliginosa MF-IS2]|uniref:Uncharacterized protein n=1 Tax=Macrolepiota fuliginosa MF-IS2 TaxID=1400762 RepID=A0A9P5XK37_9AGAR|nr:hypothetical protein P691DRAFT_757473 [Macrolepiota fuliginosa MF-IS2]
MSSQIENPMNALMKEGVGQYQAHNHAANADEHTNNGLIVLAMEEHFKAAKAYIAAIERSHDESAKRTLHMLYNEQSKAAKDLQRRIEKLKEEGKDPLQPQPIATVPTVNVQPKNVMAPVPRTVNTHPHVPGRIESPQPLQMMTDTVDESFMLLGGQRSEPGDPFNHFWNIMQGMLDTLSSPVAFATAPLGNPESAETQNSSAHGSANLNSKTPSGSGSLSKRDPSFGSDTEVDEPILARLGRRIGMARESMGGIKHGSSSQKSHIRVLDDDEDFDESLFDDGDDLSESFLVIPSGSEPGALKKENMVLKTELANMQRQLEMAEKMLHLRDKQGQQLRDSIYQASKEAQRAMGASMHQRIGPDLSNLNLNAPPLPIPGLTHNRENQYLQRIKELENEIRQARIENEKNQAMIRKYRERWEKLKESAKRKKEAKVAAIAAASPVRERIVEEPEAEEELDNTY